MDNVNHTTATPDTPGEANYRREAWTGLCDIGLTYLFGGVGYSFYHFVKATRNSPSGQRFISGIRSVRANAPPAAAALAFWGGGVYLGSKRAVKYLRQKDDIWNKTAGATVLATGMLYNGHRGVRPSCKVGLGCGAVLCIMLSTIAAFQEKRRAVQVCINNYFD